MNHATLERPVPPARPAPERLLRMDAASLDNPYLDYAALREAGPLHWSESFFGGAWVLTRHADCEMALRDPRFSAQRTGGWVMRGEQARGELGAFQRLFSRAMLFVDAPDHTRLRALMQPSFTPSAIAGLHGWIAQRCSELMDAMDGLGPVDFMQQLARPLPAGVIAQLLGLPPSDQADVMVWSDDIAAFIGSANPDAQATRRAQRGLLPMAEYFGRVFEERRADPGPGLVGRLLQAQAEGSIRSGAELLAQCTMLLFAGHETTRNLLGNAVQALLSHPEQWQLLQRQPELLPQAVRELLRYDSPVQYTGRRVATPMTLHGQQLQRGDLVIVLIGAANRDPARFDRPDELDITRRGVSSLSLGSGPHVCIGAALSLLETETVLAQMLQRWPRAELAGSQPRWLGNPLYRGLKELRLWPHGIAG